jgi:hypothetical protein
MELIPLLGLGVGIALALTFVSSLHWDRLSQLAAYAA